MLVKTCDLNHETKCFMHQLFQINQDNIKAN